MPSPNAMQRNLRLLERAAKRAALTPADRARSNETGLGSFTAADSDPSTGEFRYVGLLDITPFGAEGFTLA